VSFFVPITIAAVAGTLITRIFIGDVAAFSIPPYEIVSYWEMPAFALLGVAAAVVAIVFQFLLIAADTAARGIVLPTWLRPVLGGLIVGAIGVFVPEILGVGYEATDIALHGAFAFQTLMLLLLVKMAATALTLASRFGGGIFSPSLYLGAMTGGAFGIVAATAFPEYASDIGLYAILGMGAVAAAMLGAPISTTMIVFELTGGYALSIALLLTVSIATALHLAAHGRSYFEWQLESRGVNLHHAYHLKALKVASFMTPGEKSRLMEEAAAIESRLKPTDTLETTLRRFNELGVDVLAVVDPGDEGRIVGTVSHVQALSAYNRRLVETSLEEHR
jgi:CIC family chloride channel protein